MYRFFLLLLGVCGALNGMAETYRVQVRRMALCQEVDLPASITSYEKLVACIRKRAPRLRIPGGCPVMLTNDRSVKLMVPAGRDWGDRFGRIYAVQVYS